MDQVSQLSPIHKACRHLLRHLDDPRALATNALVGPVFQHDRAGKITRKNSRRTLASVRGLLRVVANDLLARDGRITTTTTMRQHQILLRCDLAGEPHKLVAADLGLSMRQFYRERQVMIERLAELLVDRFCAYGAEPACAIDIATMELARAKALQFGGETVKAITLLRSLASSSEDSGTVISAQAQIVTILVERNAFAESWDELARMQAFVARRESDPIDTIELNAARIALEKRNLLWCSGRELQALESDRAALPKVMAFACSGRRPEQELAAYALTHAGRRMFMVGRFQSAREQLETARDLLALRSDAPVDLHIHLLVLYGVLLSTLREQRAATSVTFVDAASLAVRHGLSELAVLASIGLSIDDQMRGDSELALQHVRSVLPLGRKVASPLNRGHLCLRAAELEGGAGNGTVALALLDEAERDLVPGTYAWTYKNLLNAQARLSIRDFAGARQYAELAVSTAAAQRNGRPEGTALRVSAENSTGLNARSDAIEAIESAIARLESCGYPLVLLQAYRRQRI
ncbi:MAG: hypothetical protein ACXWNK_12050 [Vulcanimicrobiaceae bacterium]